jgi:hypothetical protein
MWAAAVFIDFPESRYKSTYDQVYDSDLGEHLSIIFYQGNKDEAIDFISNKYGNNIVNYDFFYNKDLMMLWNEIKTQKDTTKKLFSKTIDDVLKACDVRIFRQNQYIREGFHCFKCNDYYEYAKANQPNGTFICYSCKLWNYVGRGEEP